MGSMSMLHELGDVQLKIAKKLAANKKLCKLLKFTDEDPLSHELSPNEKIIHHNILTAPLIDYEHAKEGYVVINLVFGAVNYANDEFINLRFQIDIFTAYDTWITVEDQLRPIQIMDEIANELNRKRISSIGMMMFDSFELEIVSEDVGCYHMTFQVDVNG